MKFIEIKKEYLPIKKNFKLEDMKKMNVIAGKNNVGKTRFFEAIEKEYVDIFDIVFIKSKDVNPAENQFKTTAITSDLIKNVSKLFNNLKITPSLNINDIKPKLENLVEKTNSNFKKFTSNEDINISSKIADNIKIETVIQSLMDKFEINENYIETPLKLENIGQGYQRMLVASILKSYADLIKEIGAKEINSDNKEVLLLFEEPEIFLHPELKRILNKVLKDISEIPNYTVIISTHDPYFLWSNLNDENIQIYSFVKENGLTIPYKDSTSSEIEDEMLHIYLFNKLISEMKKKNLHFNLAEKMESTSADMESYLETKEVKKKSYIWKENTYNILLPIFIRNVIHHRPIDEYTGDELKESVKMLNIILSKV